MIQRQVAAAPTIIRILSESASINCCYRVSAKSRSSGSCAPTIKHTSRKQNLYYCTAYHSVIVKLQSLNRPAQPTFQVCLHYLRAVWLSACQRNHKYNLQGRIQEIFDCRSSHQLAAVQSPACNC